MRTCTASHSKQYRHFALLMANTVLPYGAIMRRGKILANHQLFTNILPTNIFH